MKMVIKYGSKVEQQSRNERRYVLQMMQQGTWDYKSDGIKQLEYELLETVVINQKYNGKTYKCKIR